MNKLKIKIILAAGIVTAMSGIVYMYQTLSHKRIFIDISNNEIIGSADGATAIYVSGNSILEILILFIMILAIIFIVRRKIKNRKIK